MTIALFRTLILYIVVITCIRLMGKRQISELQPSELVVTLLISDIAVIPMQNTAQPLLSGILPIVILVSCELIISTIMVKNAKFRRFICGKPIIVINDGKIQQSEMKRLRMTTEDLSEQLRQLDVFSLSEVAFAIIETNGKMSVLKKPSEQPPSAKTLGVFVPDNGIDMVVISDGDFSNYSLELLGLTKDWVMGVLNGKNLELKEVFIMTANKHREFKIIEKENRG